MSPHYPEVLVVDCPVRDGTEVQTSCLTSTFECVLFFLCVSPTFRGENVFEDLKNKESGISYYVFGSSLLCCDWEDYWIKMNRKNNKIN